MKGMVMGKDVAVGFLGLLLGLVGCAGPRVRDVPSMQPVTRFSSAGSGAAAPATAPVSPPAPPAGSPATPTVKQTSADAPMQADANPDKVPATPQPSVAADPVAPLRAMKQRAAERWAAMDSYICRVRRREQVNGKDRPEELLIFKLRKQPFSVYFKFLGPEGQGREVTYVKGQYSDQIHTLLAAGDMPFAPAGKRMALAPDSIFVRSASRHTITEAGFGQCVERFGKLVEAFARGESRVGTVKYLGFVKRPEYETPLEAAEHAIPAGFDPNLPRGGRRQLMFDPASHLPVLVITQDETGHEVEYYCSDRIEWPVKLDDNDFNPDKLWPAK